MKKYLMGGIAAVAICAAFTSCSKNNELFDQNAAEQAKQQTSEQKIISDYQTAFENAFGKPASNQDWGLGQYGSINKAGTRATGEFANHVGAYPDANMWTSKGFLAPDPLTQSQKLRAQYYFQMNRIVNPNRPNYGTKDFFVQQVYDGGTDPMAGKSAEVYDAADGSTKINSGEHMDHLTAGPDHLHIYNFNNGTCSTNGNVANRDQTDVNNTNQQHSDEIQLMLNTPTSCFGYANSDASCVRDDRWTLVSAATIDAFCDGDANFKTWLAERLNSGEVDKKCDDEFHRDFIGFDFDMIPDESIFSGTEVWVDKENPSWPGEKEYKGKTYSEWDYYRYDLYGAKYHFVSANRNQYCGESQTIDPEPSDDDALTLLQNGWLPASGSANKTWVKVGGCNDGYFSDWIVTFMPATSGDEITYQGRIMGEDLTAMSDNDFDFNDVVFDWAISADGKTAYIKLLAAGGTLPLKIGTAVGEGQEVHALFGVSTSTMVNTGVGANGITKEPVEFTITKTTGTFNNAADIIVSVDKTSKGAQGYMQMSSKVGDAPCLLFVPLNTKWVDEYENIEKAYTWFKDYVGGTTDKWSEAPVEKYVDLDLSNNK
jgi:hypothetical protein